MVTLEDVADEYMMRHTSYLKWKEYMKISDIARKIAELIVELDIETEVNAELHQPDKKSIADQVWCYHYDSKPIFHEGGKVVDLDEWGPQIALLPELVREVQKHINMHAGEHGNLRKILKSMDVPVEPWRHT